MDTPPNQAVSLIVWYDEKPGISWEVSGENQVSDNTKISGNTVLESNIDKRESELAE